MRLTHSSTLLGVLLGAASTTQVRAAPAAADVLIVTTQPDGGRSFPTIDFFQAALTEIKTSATWTVAPLAQVRGLMKGQRRELGPIPSLNRSELLNALPKPKREGVIPALQAPLDTLAVDAAVVVDCEPAGESAVKACGLYYYDRAAGRITASARKEFKVGIADAGAWAPTLVATLKKGMDGARSEREKAQFKDLLDRSAESEHAPLSMTLGLDALGESLKTPDAHLTNQMSYGFQLLARGASAGFGVEAGTGGGSASAARTSFTASTRRLGLVVNVRAKAMDSLIWQTDLAAGAVARRYDSSAGDSLATRGAYLALRPALAFAVTPRFSFGAGLSLSRYFLGASESSGAYAATALNPTAVGALFRVQAELF